MIEQLSRPRKSAEAADRLCGLLDVIAATEREISALQARQLSQVAEFVAAREDFEVAHYGVVTQAGQRMVAAELSDARRVGVWAARSHLDQARRLVQDLPLVLAKLAAGTISLTSARTAAAETYPLHPAALPLADEVIAAEIDTVLPGQVKAMVRTRVLELDPAAIEAAMQARRDRFITGSVDALSSMGALTAHLPAEQVAACWNALDHHARGVHASGDERTVSQIMTDTLVERVTGAMAASQPPVLVNVVMNCSTLFGLDDVPAQLDTLGPLPAAIARGLAAGDRAWLRRWFTDPADGTVATVDTARRRFTGGLRHLVRARDRRCRGIGCDAAIRDGDHLVDHAKGGPTSAANAAGECEHCHHLKDHPDLTVEPVGGYDVWGRRTRQAETGAAAALLRWTTPIGRTVLTQARPALGYGTATRAQLRHRRRRRELADCPPVQSPPRPDLVTSSHLELKLRRQLQYAA